MAGRGGVKKICGAGPAGNNYIGLLIIYEWGFHIYRGTGNHIKIQTMKCYQI